MQCPHCGLETPSSRLRCDCGWERETTAPKRPIGLWRAGQGKSTIIIVLIGIGLCAMSSLLSLFKAPAFHSPSHRELMGLYVLVAVNYMPAAIPLVMFHKRRRWQISVLILLALLTAFDLWWFFPWWELEERTEGISWDSVVMLSRMALNVALIMVSAPIAMYLALSRSPSS